MSKNYFRGSNGFDLYIVNDDGNLIEHGVFRTLDDAVDGAIDANLPADQMCIVQRDRTAHRVLAVPAGRIPAVEEGMKPADR